MDLGIVLLISISSPIFYFFAYMYGGTAVTCVRETWVNDGDLLSKVVVLIYATLWIGTSLVFLGGAVLKYGFDGFLGMVIGGTILLFWSRRYS